MLPCVFRGMGTTWNASNWVNRTSFVQRFGHEMFNVELRKEQFRNGSNEPTTKRKMTLKTFLQQHQQEDLYLDAPLTGSTLLHDLPLPKVLQCDALSQTINSVNFLYSSGQTSSYLHQDGYQNLLTVHAGIKTVLLAPPSSSTLLYANEFTLLPGLSPVNPDEVNLTRYPLVAQVKFWKVVLHQGDSLYIPQYYWHHVISTVEGEKDGRVKDGQTLPSNIATNIWFQMLDYEVELQTKEGLDEAKDVSAFGMKYSEYVRKLAPKKIRCSGGDQQHISLHVLLERQAGQDGTDDPAVSNYQQEMTKVMPPLSDLVMPSGWTIPRIGFGTARLGRSTERWVDEALSAGYRLIDTANDHFGYDDAAVGRALSKEQLSTRSENSDDVDNNNNNNNVFVVTKIQPGDFGPTTTLLAVRRAQSALGASRPLDLVLLHGPFCDEEDVQGGCADGSSGTWQEAWRVLTEEKRKGTIRSIGVSNFEANEVMELLAINKDKKNASIDVIQNPCDPYSQDVEVRRIASEHGIVYQAHSALGTMWVDDCEELRGQSPVLQDMHLRMIAMELGMSTVQVVLRWLVQEGVSVLVRSSNVEHLRSNLDVVAHLVLGMEEMAVIRGLDGVNPCVSLGPTEVEVAVAVAVAVAVEVAVEVAVAVEVEVDTTERSTSFVDGDDCLDRRCASVWGNCERFDDCKSCEEGCVVANEEGMEKEEADETWRKCCVECAGATSNLRVVEAMSQLLACAVPCLALDYSPDMYM